MAPKQYTSFFLLPWHLEELELCAGKVTAAFWNSKRGYSLKR